MAERASLISLALEAGLIGPAVLRAPLNCQNSKISHGGGCSSSSVNSRYGTGRRASRAGAASRTAIQNRIFPKGASALRSVLRAALFPVRERAFSHPALATSAQWFEAVSFVRGNQVLRKAQQRCIAGSTHHARRAPFLGFSGVEIGVCGPLAAQARC